MRRKLPYRRPSENFDVIGEDGHKVTATVGFHVEQDGRMTPGELFISDRGKTGAALDHIFYDAGVAVSLAMQNGSSPTELAASMSRSGRGGALSVIGKALSMADKGG